jgi:superfamily I DNA and/or RNA helicase
MKKSLFERLIEMGPGGKGWTSVLLNMQRRMHPTISKFSNVNFYEGKIEDHPECGEPDEGVSGIPWFSQDRRVVFVNTAKSIKHTVGEEVVGTSTRNLGECVGIVEAIDRLLRSNITPEQIGVIVPYLAQKSLVTSLLRQRIPREKFLRLHVNTVEGFQGNEKDFIIISLVRSNAGGFIGFVDDDQRMNVMLTRARKGLLVFGDSKTFEASAGGSSLWKEWIQWCSNHCIKLELDELVG